MITRFVALVDIEFLAIPYALTIFFWGGGRRQILGEFLAESVAESWTAFIG
jgi:hypothetical protein